MSNNKEISMKALVEKLDKAKTIAQEIEEIKTSNRKLPKVGLAISGVTKCYDIGFPEADKAWSKLIDLIINDRKTKLNQIVSEIGIPSPVID